MIRLFLCIIFLVDGAAAQSNSEQQTDILIKYYQELFDKNLIGIEQLNRLSKSGEVTNPFIEAEAHEPKVNVAFSNINRMLELAHKRKAAGIAKLDNAKIKNWAINKLVELGHNAQTKDEVRDLTKKLHRPITFIPIPAGTYVSSIDGQEFEIPEGIEIQDTEMTPYQRQYVTNIFLGQPLDDYVDFPFTNFSPDDELERVVQLANHGSDHLRVLFDAMGQTIPASIEKHEDYTYSLPSVYEYEAILQHALGTNWVDRLKDLNIHAATNQDGDNDTHEAGTRNYIGFGKYRIYDIIGNVWEFTRDTVQLGSDQAQLVFGGDCLTDMQSIKSPTSLVGPIFYKNTTPNHFGYRLIRYKKNKNIACERRSLNITWQKNHPVGSQWKWSHGDDNAWVWHLIKPSWVLQSEECRYMMDRQDTYSPKIAQTIKAIPSSSCHTTAGYGNNIRCNPDVYGGTACRDLRPLTILPNVTSVHFLLQNISDISPLIKIKNLTELRFVNSNISTAAPFDFLLHLQNLELLTIDNHLIEKPEIIGQLTKLTYLTLSGNNIKDISFVEKLHKLVHLTIYDNPVQVIHPLGIHKYRASSTNPDLSISLDKFTREYVEVGMAKFYASIFLYIGSVVAILKTYRAMRGAVEHYAHSIGI